MTTPTKTTARKTTPAKVETKPESEASKATRSAPLDMAFLQAVKPVSAPRPSVESGRGRKAEDNSLVEGWLKNSWDERVVDEAATKRAKGTPKHVGAAFALPQIPADKLGSLKNKFNRAAATLNVGVSFGEKKNDNGTVTLTYYAKTRKTAK